MDRQRIGKAQIASLQPGETIWDSGVIGFGARRQTGSVISYILKCRTKDGVQRKITIGRHGQPWTPDTARNEAKKQLGQIAGGADPSVEKKADKAAMDVAKFCDSYLADAREGRLLTRRRVSKKASTLATDEGRIERHIKPLLGKLKVAAVTRDDVEQFMHDVANGKTAIREKTAKRGGVSEVRGGKGTASRTVGLLGAIFTYAVRKKLRGDNPVHGVVRFADGKRERRLSNTEYHMLGNGLAVSDAAGLWPPAVAAVRFLLLTGWRSGEAVTLKWADLDLERQTALLPDSKSGRSMRPLSKDACAIIDGLTKSDGYVFAASRGAGSMTGLPSFWRHVAKAAALPSDITPHVLRHSFASLASDLGYSEPTIAALIGHAGRGVTSRYVHSADAVLLAAADTIADRIEELMRGA